MRAPWIVALCSLGLALGAESALGGSVVTYPLQETTSQEAVSQEKSTGEESPPAQGTVEEQVQESVATEASAETAAPSPARAADLGTGLYQDFVWRELGPTTMGGRITDIAVHPDKPRIYYVASATGGLWRTRNGGSRFEPVFEHGGSGSVGAIGISPCTPDLVWIGTGEANPRNSVSFGDGVYRSDDAGDTWTHCGLESTMHIGAIAADPKNPDIAFVAAMGSTWGPSEQRGLFRTKDRGASWEHVLKVDEKTGCIDVVIDPSDPRVVYAATYQRQRDRFDGNDVAEATGPGSGIWRSIDGGDHFTRLSGGLPTVAMGRIGLQLWAKDTNVLWAIVETERMGERSAGKRSEDQVSLGIRGRDADQGGFLVESVTEGESAHQAGLTANDVVTRVGDTETPDRATLVATLQQFRPGQQVDVAFRRGSEEEVVTLTFLGRLLDRGGRSFAGSQGGQIENAQEQQGPDGFETGGIFRSADRGETWKRVNSLDPRPFYYSQIRVDPWTEDNVYVCGIDFHVSRDAGKTFETNNASNVHPDHHALWIDPRDPEHLLLGNDGGLYETVDRCASWRFVGNLPIAQFYNVAVDMSLPYRVFGGLQDNGSWGGPSATRKNGIVAADWIKLNGGDGFHAAVDPEDPDVTYTESQNGAILRWNLRTGEQSRVRRPRGDFRLNWNTPFLLSPHNSKIFFHAGNVVFRSLDQGDSCQIISPEIALTEQGSATALEQSSVDADLLFVGTDDGALWRTTDGGREWVPIHERLPGVPGPLYVSDIECSVYDADVLYVTLDGHRSNDFAPRLYVSRDRGETFTAIVDTLPANLPIRCVAEDPVNRDLLFCGNEIGCFVSQNGGATWTRFTSGLPTVPVFDLVVHPRDHELVAATHGRGVWVVDVAPLEEMRRDDFGAGARPLLLAVKPVHLWRQDPASEGWGEQGFVAGNPFRGASIWYFLPTDLEETLKVAIADSVGGSVRELDAPNTAGLHRLAYDLRGGRRGGGGGGGAGFGGGGGIEEGDYRVELKVGEETLAQRLRILPDPRETELQSRFAR